MTPYALYALSQHITAGRNYRHELRAWNNLYAHRRWLYAVALIGAGIMVGKLF